MQCNGQWQWQCHIMLVPYTFPRIIIIMHTNNITQQYLILESYKSNLVIIGLTRTILTRRQPAAKHRYEFGAQISFHTHG